MNDDLQRRTQGTGMNTTPGTQGYTTDANGEVVIPEYKEELVAQKVEQQEGMVHVHKDVIQEQKTVSAPVTHEEVDVERVPVNNQLDTAPADAFQETDLNIPLRGEELVAGKQVVESEEVRLRKHQVQEQEQVTGTVRREQVQVDQPTQTTSTQGTQGMTAETVQTTPLQGTTTGSTIQGSDTFAQSGTTQQGTTYRIEADSAQETVGTTGSTIQGTSQQTGSTIQGGAQQAGQKAQEGAGDAKSKLDSVIDGVADKLTGHGH
jgi:uncharacterized protein (TIGR02271 family)